MNNLGLNVFGRQWGKKSVPHAIKLFTLSAKSDNPRAAYILGLVYYKELADFNNALTWFQRAATLGDSEAGFLIWVICMDRVKVRRWILKKPSIGIKAWQIIKPYFNAEFQAKVKAKIAELKALAKDH